MIASFAGCPVSRHNTPNPLAHPTPRRSQQNDPRPPHSASACRRRIQRSTPSIFVFDGSFSIDPPPERLDQKPPATIAGYFSPNTARNLKDLQRLLLRRNLRIHRQLHIDTGIHHRLDLRDLSSSLIPFWWTKSKTQLLMIDQRSLLPAHDRRASPASGPVRQVRQTYVILLRELPLPRDLRRHAVSERVQLPRLDVADMKDVMPDGTKGRGRQQRPPSL